MLKKKKINLVIIPLVLIVILIVIGIEFKKYYSKSIPTNDKPTIKIGIIAPMSGNLGFIGDGIKTAINIFKEEYINSRFSYNIIVEDSQMHPAKAMTIVKKMIDFDKVDILITFGSAPGIAIGHITNALGLPQFVIGNEEKVVQGKYNLSLLAPTAMETGALLEELTKRGYKKISIVAQNESGQLGLVEPFHELNNKHFEIISFNKINTGERDFRLLIQKIIALKPQIIVAQLLPPELPLFLKQLKEVAADLPVTNAETIEIVENKSLVEGYWYVTPTQPTDEFIELFHKKGATVTNFAEYTYNGLQIIDETYQLNKEAWINELLEGNKYQTAIGEVYFNSEGFLIFDAVIKEIKNGKPILIKN